jgi:hypothetical protein
MANFTGVGEFATNEKVKNDLKGSGESGIT